MLVIFSSKFCIGLSLSVAATIISSARTRHAFTSKIYRERRENISPFSRRPGMFSTGAWLHGGERLRTSLQGRTQTNMAKGEGIRSDEQSADLDQYAKDALDEVFSKEQQSYEAFVQGFMFLTKGKDA